MMPRFSLLLALAARHGDTLKNAIKGDVDARRLLLTLGLHPDDLDAMVRRRADPGTQGSAWLTLLDERDRAKSMVREILHLLGPGVEDARLGIAHLKAQADHLLARHREVRNALGVDVGGDAVAAVQALKAELEEALYDRRWVARALRVDHREHGHLGGLVETQCELHADLSKRMEQIRVLLGVGGNDDVPDAIRTQADFERQLAEADEHVRVLEGRLAAAEAASEHGPIVDLLAMDRHALVSAWRRDDGDYNVDCGKFRGHGATVREALLDLREKVKATLPKPDAAKPPEPIVLGPWESESGPGWSRWSRQIVGTDIDGITVGQGGWVVVDRAGGYVVDGSGAGNEGKAAADCWARKNGYVLLDAEPGSFRGGLVPWEDREGVYICGPSGADSLTIFASKSDRGWRIFVYGNKLFKPHTPIAHGPQIGEEGKRYALAAARALGKTWSER